MTTSEGLEEDMEVSQDDNDQEDGFQESSEYDDQMDRTIEQAMPNRRNRHCRLRNPNHLRSPTFGTPDTKS